MTGQDVYALRPDSVETGPRLLHGDALARVELQHGLQQVHRRRARIWEQRPEWDPLRTHPVGRYTACHLLD